MSALTRELILARPLQTKSVNVPEWGGEVFVRSLTGSEVDRIAKLQDADDKDTVGVQATIVSCGVCDADGKSLFAAEDLERIRDLAYPLLNRLTKEINEASGLKKEAVEEAEKN